MAWLLVHNLPLDGGDSEAVGALVERLVGAVGTCLEDVNSFQESALRQSRRALREGFLVRARKDDEVCAPTTDPEGIAWEPAVCALFSQLLKNISTNHAVWPSW